jgi:hypothetical protein
MKKATDIATQMGTCMQKAMGAAGATTPPATTPPATK